MTRTENAPFDTCPDRCLTVGSYREIRDPMITVRSRGRLKYSAASAVNAAVAMKIRWRQADIASCDGAAISRLQVLDR